MSFCRFIMSWFKLMILRISDQRYFISIPLFPKEIKKKVVVGVWSFFLCASSFGTSRPLSLSVALVNKVLLDRETISPSSLFRTRLGGP